MPLPPSIRAAVDDLAHADLALEQALIVYIRENTITPPIAPDAALESENAALRQQVTSLQEQLAMIPELTELLETIKAERSETEGALDQGYDEEDVDEEEEDDTQPRVAPPVLRPAPPARRQRRR